MVGVYGTDDAANIGYLCLYALQHRGQEGSGIATGDGEEIHLHKATGQVAEIYKKNVLLSLKGNLAIGSNKYSTEKDRHKRNLLPLVAELPFGQFAVTFSGALLSDKSREELIKSGTLFTTSTDTEILLHLIARKSSNMQLEEAITETLKELKGAYSALFMTTDKLIAARDPNGFKSLILGRTGSTYVVVSESAALDLIGADFIREVEPGEVLTVDKDGLRTYANIGRKEHHACVFEHIYIARPDSVMFGHSVYETRIECGRLLAEQIPAKADIVVPVPDSGIAAAIGYARFSGLPLELGIIRNHYVGRTFIRPTQDIRNFGVKVKLNPVKRIIRGKRLVVVDDSIVRGTTCQKIVQMLKEAGAKEVHMRIASPQIFFPCKYGIDVPTKDDLIANRYTLDGIREFIGADSLGFISLDNLIYAAGGPNYCCACFSGDYPLTEET